MNPLKVLLKQTKKHESGYRGVIPRKTRKRVLKIHFNCFFDKRDFFRAACVDLRMSSGDGCFPPLSPDNREVIHDQNHNERRRSH